MKRLLLLRVHVLLAGWLAAHQSATRPCLRLGLSSRAARTVDAWAYLAEKELTQGAACFTGPCVLLLQEGQINLLTMHERACTS